MLFYTTHQISNKQQLTPEGFLLCSECPIARVGNQTYAHGEIPVESNDAGLIFIDRPETEVFRPESIASFNGKPIVDEHPRDGPVTPQTWNEKSVGVVLNPRRGDGRLTDRDFLFADLLLTNQRAIDAVRGGKRELSAGYNAEYEQLAPGRGRQHNIVGNHVALVERGRCGPLCSIGDSQGDVVMARMSAMAQDIRRQLRKAIRTHDEGSVLNALAELPRDPELLGEVLSGDDLGEPGMPVKEEGEGGHHVTINVHGAKPSMGGTDAGEEPKPGMGAAAPGGDPMGGGGGTSLEELAQRVDALEQVVAMLAGGEGGEEEEPSNVGEMAPSSTEQSDAGYGPEGGRKDGEPSGETKGENMVGSVGDQRRRAMVGDSTSLREGFVHMLSQAEILMPGIQLMTFDSARSAKDTFDAMCHFKRRALEASYGTDRGKKAIEIVLSGSRKPKSFHDSSITCDSVGLLFNGAASLLAQETAGRAHQPSFGGNGQGNAGFKQMTTIADINKANRERAAKGW